MRTSSITSFFYSSSSIFRQVWRGISYACAPVVLPTQNPEEPDLGRDVKVSCRFGMALSELRQPVNDAKSQVIPESDLHHLAGEFFADLSHILRSELQFPSTPINEMIDKQGRQVVNFLIAGMLAQI